MKPSTPASTAAGEPVAWSNDFGTHTKLSFVPLEGAYEHRALIYADTATEASDTEVADGEFIADLVEKVHALTAATTASAPVATLHDDGYWVWKGTPPHESNYAGWRMEVYAAPPATPVASVLPTITAEMVEAAYGPFLSITSDMVRRDSLVEVFRIAASMGGEKS
jgi:hypothetical protein